MSVSNKHGFIAQSEQFEDRTVASEDTTNYKVIKSGIFAYNPARINVGSIAQYKGDETCIVSPMYLCFKCGVDVVGDYLEHFFSTKYFFKEMDKRLEGSVRQCLSFEALCNIPIPLPSIEQQHCTATIIGGISKMIAAESKILQAYTKQKNYLLSTMFI
ncbi:restriction endonuclease subunit S [Muribaculaceae bacterium Isolate-042 (Harlan)]|nr:restriction endonuclease subunit S [Muribaculaceae bacterium S4]ROS79554.1 restriction endonuclease subunit S [Muribaculaceae bacterium Isolate-042 (Harlan)]